MGINKAAALEARSHNIRVNAVSPDFLATRLFESAGHDLTGTVSAGWDNFVGRQGREAHPDEVGDVVVLLSTPRMSLVNGHNLVIDGYVKYLARMQRLANFTQGFHNQRIERIESTLRACVANLIRINPTPFSLTAREAATLHNDFDYQCLSIHSSQ